MALRDWLLHPNKPEHGPQSRSKDSPGAVTKSASADLPANCPLKTGAGIPNNCRFEPRLFRRMVAEAVIPNPDGGCPLRSACPLD
jgi:hypothetical protein